MKTIAHKWIARFRAEGTAGLENRSSWPRHPHRRIPEDTLERVAVLRLQCWPGKRVADELGVSASTVSHHLRFLKLSRMKDIEPRAVIVRYEQETPGEIIHIDIKLLRRFAKSGHRVTGRHTGMARTLGVGREYLNVAIGDHFRVGFFSLMLDQTTRSAIAFLLAAVAYYRRLGVIVKGVMTENGLCHPS